MLCCPHIYALHTFRVPHKTARVKEGWQHHPKWTHHPSHWFQIPSRTFSRAEHGSRGGLRAARPWPPFQTQRALSGTGIYACRAHVYTCIFRTHVHSSAYMCAGENFPQASLGRHGRPDQLTFVPSFPARPGSPCSPGGPGGPGWPRSPIGPVSPVGPCVGSQHQPQTFPRDVPGSNLLFPN